MNIYYIVIAEYPIYGYSIDIGEGPLHYLWL